MSQSQHSLCRCEDPQWSAQSSITCVSLCCLESSLSYLVESCHFSSAAPTTQRVTTRVVTTEAPTTTAQPTTTEEVTTTVVTTTPEATTTETTTVQTTTGRVKILWSFLIAWNHLEIHTKSPDCLHNKTLYRFFLIISLKCRQWRNQFFT